MDPRTTDPAGAIVVLRHSGRRFWFVGTLIGVIAGFALLIASYGFFVAEPEVESTPVAVGALAFAFVLLFMLFALRRTGYDLEHGTMFRYNGLTLRRTHVSRVEHIRAVELQVTRINGGAAPMRYTSTQLVLWTTDPDRPQNRMHRVMSGDKRGRVTADDGLGSGPVIVASHMLGTGDQQKLREWFLANGLRPTTSDQPYPLTRG